MPQAGLQPAIQQTSAQGQCLRLRSHQISKTCLFKLRSHKNSSSGKTVFGGEVKQSQTYGM